MKIRPDELEKLWTMQQLIISQRRLVEQAKGLSSGDSFSDIEKQIQVANQVLRDLQLEYEKLLEDKRKIDSDLDLVEKRIASDEAKMKQSSSPKDIAGFQHELDGLIQRKSLLEDGELELLERIESAKHSLEKARVEKVDLEQQLQQLRDSVSNQLAQMKVENSKLNDEIGAIRAGLDSEVVQLFDKKLARGNAVGRLVRSSCTACNMNLNSTAMAELSAIASDELATCPECSAIVIRS